VEAKKNMLAHLSEEKNVIHCPISRDPSANRRSVIYCHENKRSNIIALYSI
jgi:hypothetical protein